jgi:hypothetical protein
VSGLSDSAIICEARRSRGVKRPIYL